LLLYAELDYGTDYTKDTEPLGYKTAVYWNHKAWGHLKILDECCRLLSADYLLDYCAE
jgi:hypothetical protein